eukprot:TRINITY_DN11294_c0_g1_i1.p1 TRINITY_DN11294_c0_g1~~TRINITY_DN11294_c0_g1_i1.p1  ORF type:complete len:550 (-),score=145.08 TRINITY_DN11294_c0_g1_i1:36-1685(-)
MADPEKPLTADEIAKLEIKNDETVSKKYDRQIRLWGLHGQERLHNAHICLLGAGPVGTETIKNLVLPGIGKFSVIDGEKVTNRDLGNNFFVEVSSVGKSRAEETGRLLHELNGFVEKGGFIDQDPNHLVNNNDEFVRDYDVIIANNLPDATLVKLGEQCSKWNKKLVVIKTNGLLGLVRLFANEHRVLESKPDGEKWDLRIQTPWPELQAYIDSFDLDSMLADLQKFSPEFTHVPFTVLLSKLITQWKATHDGKCPETEEDKQAFLQSIISLGKSYSISDNFREAKNYKYLTWVPYEIPYETQEIFDDEKCNNINEKSSKFWLLARAVRDFYQNEGNGHLPLAGNLPDITAKPDAYTTMQRIFREKAEKDWQSVKSHLQTLLKSVNKSPDDIRDEDIAFFCKHTSVMKVFRFSPVQNEYDSTKINKEAIEWWDENGKWYLAFRAAGRFQAEHGRLPGDRNDDPQADFENLKKVAVQLQEELELDVEEVGLDDYLKEFCRFGGCQIHNTCAFVGGVASQEVIKLVTKQWHPVDNTYIYNGITGTSAFFAV